MDRKSEFRHRLSAGATARAKSEAIVDGWLDCFVNLEGFDAVGEVGFGGIEGTRASS
jgi:hypothetical protein